MERDVIVRYVDVPGSRLWTVRQGRGPAMVLLHGGPGMWDYLEPVAAMVDDIATTYRYDQRGCGRSAGGPPYDVATAVADLDAVRAPWGVERWIVMGHSWGASLALAYAVAHPDRTRGLVYVSGTGVDPAWHAEYRANRQARIPPEKVARWDELRTLLPTTAGDDRRPLAREYAELSHATELGSPARAGELADWLYAVGFEANWECNRALGHDAHAAIETEAFAGRLRHLDLPALVVHGALDSRPARFAAGVAALIPGAELLVLPGVGHFPRFEAAEVFGAALRAFLERLL